MKKIFLLCTLILSLTIVCGQTKSPVKQDASKHETQPANTTPPPQVNVNVPTTLQIKDITEKSNNSSIIEKSMPWIVAFIIGLLSALVNFFIARQLRQSNENNLQRQIESSERNLQRQIESNERSLQRQIETAKETTITGFKATINTKNRQEWINELRHTVSQFLSHSLQLIPTVGIKFVTETEKSAFYEKLVYSKTKIELLTNPNKPEQKELLDSIEQLLVQVSKKKEDFNLDEFKAARDKTLDVSRKLFGIHWDKIKELK